MNIEELKKRNSIYKKRLLTVSIDSYKIDFINQNELSPSKLVNKLLEDFIENNKDKFEKVDEIKYLK